MEGDTTPETPETSPSSDPSSRRSVGGVVRSVCLLPLRALSRATFGTVKVDIARRRGRRYDDEDDHDHDHHFRGGLGGLRVKAYRRMAFDPYVFARRPQVDLAAGIAVDSSGGILPKCRLKVGDHIRLKALPVPTLQYKQLVRPHPSSKFVVETQVNLPLECFQELSRGEVPRKAFVGVRLRNDVSTGLHFTSHGIEFDEKVDVFGPYGTVRAAVGVDFPTEWPPKGAAQNGKPPFNLRVNRLSFTVPTP
ncbi:hypothetical protein HOP50_02g19150 [Chloropicon primus]|uniref:Uncharacterized protein n=1 Tax=Chloropicon primus TaxID=1764295 RepID=A0A5B8MJ34_9CHLO|nr:hypothetical protein A3770_02p19180 [Chloropicon primus]UPQ98609.1 hypothetical protein HOP50_02g19150 [Chloropicon primus]|eukprot:QDZ19400.1 hypothetical protein A3770_02p19180 [Chloropicon primus]